MSYINNLNESEKKAELIYNVTDIFLERNN